MCNDSTGNALEYITKGLRYNVDLSYHNGKFFVLVSDRDGEVAWGENPDFAAAVDDALYYAKGV